jgi:CBS domain containing-hemolysin-like protein
MSGPEPSLDASAYAWRIAATLFFVAANSFFVAAEFALVKVRATQLHALAEAGSRRARLARHLHERLDHYLSACQLGITLASLILGWLAEPAVAQLMLAGASAAGWGLSPEDPWVHGAALALALALVTVLHMTVGEQAPKMWAIKRSEGTALWVAGPLRLFAGVFRPVIWGINGLSNALLRTVGLTVEELGEAGIHNVDELRRILVSSAEAGHISERQLELAENVFSIVGLEVRHILVPRVDAVFLSLQSPPEENLRILRESGHSRVPLCRVGLDSVVGVVHVKDVMRELCGGDAPDLGTLARSPVFVSDTQPLPRFIVRMQRTRSHLAIVLDEHGTAVGLAFLEDALEEIVGPIADEFDEAAPAVRELEGGVVEVPGSLALPEAAELLDLPGLGQESDTIGGHVVATLGRLPEKGDVLAIGPYRVKVLELARNRIARLRFESAQPAPASDDEAKPSS